MTADERATLITAARDWAEDQEPITPERLEAGAGWDSLDNGTWSHRDRAGLYLKCHGGRWRVEGDVGNLSPRTMGHLKALIEMTE